MAERRSQRPHEEVDAQTRALRLLCNTLGWLAPGLVAARLEALWRRVRIYPAPPREREWREQAQVEQLDFEGEPLQLWCWGDAQAPVVLLVHGWAGRGSQLGAFAAPLAAAGYRVLAADLPGHGADDPRKSRQTDVAACARLLLHLDQRFGPLAGLVGHSFGVVASSLACREGLRLRRFVGIGTPAFGDRMLDAFCRHMRMPAPVERALHRRMAKRLGEDFLSRMSAAENARFCHCAALILHDAQDRAVSAEAGEAVAEAWAGGAEFRKTTGLGHFRILRDADVIAEVARFIAAGDPAAAQAIDETATATLSAPSHGASG